MADSRAPAFRDLLGDQIASTADALRRSAAMRMRREHDVSLAQVRILALIDHLQPVRLRDVAADAGADKAQVSRVVSSLVARRLVTRHSISGDARSAHLELTPDGRDKVRAIVRTLQDRDRALRASLQPGEPERLGALLAQVRKAADQITLEEERLAPPNGAHGH